MYKGNLLKLINDSSLRKTLGVNAVKTARDKFDVGNAIKAYLGI